MTTRFKQTISSILRGRIVTAAATAVAMVLSTHANAEVSQVPLSLSVGVPPNIIFTLDESGSMSWGYVPDAGTVTYTNLIGASSTSASKRFRAAITNPMAYNPSVIYQIPPAYLSSGAPLSLSTSFDAAKINGFETSATANRGSTNLRTGYRVIKEHRIPAGTFNYANHLSDSLTCTMSLSNDRSDSCMVKNGAFGQLVFNIRRSSNTSCTATLAIDDNVINAACSTSRNNPVVASYAIEKDGRQSYSKAAPAHYYEFDGSLAGGQCETKKETINKGGEGCYRIRFVDKTAAYDGHGNRLLHPDPSNKRYPDVDEVNGNVYVDGRSNFAIWYSFYRTRALATLSAASIAFDDLTPNVRFTWQSLNTCDLEGNRSGGASRCRDNSLKPYSSAHKGEFYTWLRQIYFNVGTPLHSALNRAGTFLTKEKAFFEYPETNTKGEIYSCRASYHVLMTDGMWNENYTVNSTKKDHQNFSLPEGGYPYRQHKPFYDSTNNTLADLAMHYWATDLHTGLDNNVPAHIPYRNEDKEKEYWDPRNNPATWQHMSNFILGLGLTNALDNASVPWEGSTFTGEGYQKLREGSADWPAASNNSSNNVYDLWHAAINSRGEFYSVDDPDAMVQAFKDILDRIAERESSAAKPGVSSSLEEAVDPFEDGATADRLARYFYHTTYDSAGWTGELRKTRLVRECVAREIADPDSDPDDPQVDTVLECNEVENDGWRASDKLPAYGSRNIKVSNGSALEDFTVAGVNAIAGLRSELEKQPPGRSATQISTLAEHVNYLRGDQRNESSKPEMFRQRSSLLGDMLGSSPAYVGGPRYIPQAANKIDSGYDSLVIKAKTRAPMIYVGANDGMLHGFDAETGVEKFAFIPTAVFGNLLELLNPNYSHRFYVDGTPVIADAYNGTEWRTILVGTLRAGGKGIFALDVTDPTDIKLLWELNEGDVRGQVQPGYSFPEPTVVRMHNGRWAVITGNGYEGAGTNSGKAALFVIDAFTGETRSLEVASEAGGKNGLSTPRVVDLDGDGVADFAYAGDLQGNLWRFDLLGATASGGSEAYPNGYFGGKNDGNGDSFKPSYNGKPLFVAKDNTNRRQPITAPPSVVRHPSGQGYIVIAGTGKYFEYNDDTSTELNSLYGVWDANTRGPSSGNAPQISRSNLVKQEVTTQSRSNNAASGVERDVRVLSSNTVDWANPGDSNGKLGWYLDLRFSGNRDGEMIIEGMRTLGNMLLFQTLLPNDDPCADGSTTWLYALNPATGGATGHDPFGYDKVNGGVVSGISFGSEGGFSLSQGELDFSVHSGGEKERINPPPEAMGRQTWRIIHNP